MSLQYVDPFVRTIAACERARDGLERIAADFAAIAAASRADIARLEAWKREQALKNSQFAGGAHA